MEQSAKKKAEIMQYIQQQQSHDQDDDLPPARDRPTNMWISALLFIPRCIGGGLLFACQMIFYLFMLLYLFLRILAFPFMGFRISGVQRKTVKRDIGRVNERFVKSWHVMLGCS
jgi:hypothetical protein